MHAGHVHAAIAVADALDLDHVQMVLAARPGHREQPTVGIEHRLTMLRLACAQDARLVADDSEVRREGHSYTIDTLDQASQLRPAERRCWLIGQDAFATLPQWHRWQELFNHANIVVLARPAAQADADGANEPDELRQVCAQREVDRLDNARHGQILRLHLPMLTVSSTLVRALLSSEKGVEKGAELSADQLYALDDLLDPQVAAYVEEHQLYRSNDI